MRKRFKKNDIGISDEYSGIFDSIYGEQKGSSQFSAYEEDINSSYSNGYDDDFVRQNGSYYPADGTGAYYESDNSEYYPEDEYPDDGQYYVNSYGQPENQYDYPDQYYDAYESNGNYSESYVNEYEDNYYQQNSDYSPEYMDESYNNYDNSNAQYGNYVNPDYQQQYIENPEENDDISYSNEYEYNNLQDDNYTYVNQYSDDNSEYVSVNSNYDDNPYTDDDDFYYENDEYEEKVSKSSSFFNYVTSRITGILFRLRGGVSASSTAATMYENDDELGREVTPKYACNYYGDYIYSLGIRIRIVTGLIFFLAYFSLSLPLPGALKNPEVLAACILSMHFTIILLCLDVFTTGLGNLFSGNCGADSLAAVSCLFTAADAIMIITKQSTIHVPLCLISSLSLYGVLYSSLLSTRGMRKALRVPSIGHRRYCVTCEKGVVGQGITVLKSTRSIIGFVRRTEEEPVDEHAFKKFSPFILLLSAVFTILVVLKNGFSNTFLYIFTMFFTPAVPFTALLCFALPYYHGSKRIFSYGAAIAGYSGSCDLGHSKNLIVTDRDLFPEECIEIGDVRIFADYDSNKVISYVSSMIKESDSSLVGAFDKLLVENSCQYSHVDNFEVLQGGGFKALIEGHVVLCGNVDLMRLMDIKIPFKLVSTTSVLLSIDGVLYGIFNLKYSADDDVRKALVGLMRSNRHPVFATRDFNVTPDMIKDIFDVATDGYDFPPYADRFPISMAKPSHDSQISAVVCREGLGSLTALADAGRSIFVISKMNTVLSVASALIAPIFVFILAVMGKTLGTVPLFLYSVITSIPIIILGIIAKVPN